MSSIKCAYLFSGTAALVLCACADKFYSAGDGGPDAGSCTAGETRCDGQAYQTCVDDRFITQTVCPEGQVCSVTLKGCAQCEPGTPICVGDDSHNCGDDGKIAELVKTCMKGQCQGGVCSDPCSQAEARRSYVGCSYWPTVTINSQVLEDFAYAVVVANTYEEPANVTVSTATNPSVATAIVPGGSLTTIRLPWVKNLKQAFSAGGTRTLERSILEPAGAYHLTSTLPVTVYQFNALEFVLKHDCKFGDPPPGTPPGTCYSYTNDASLLLPEHALHQEYIVVSRPTMWTKVPGGFLLPDVIVQSPGFLAVTAPKAGSTRVTITFTANTQAGAPGALAAYLKGQTADFQIPQGGVLQIVSAIPASCPSALKSDAMGQYCDLSADTDLTGTLITSDQDVALYSGHNCSFVPHDKWACDHLEEQIFPLKAWGKRYHGTHAASSGTDPGLYRVISAEDGNAITFNPPVHPPITLQKGKFVEFTATEDFEASGSARLLLVQFMVGQNYSNLSPGQGAPGDPAMALAVPVEQYRTAYRFLAPETYEQNYVNVIAPTEASVKLDDAFVDEATFKPLGATGFKVAKIKIAGGAHNLDANVGFGITVYGVGSYTSYMYPGGLDLKLLID